MSENRGTSVRYERVQKSYDDEILVLRTSISTSPVANF
jgi:hypothetical protein